MAGMFPSSKIDRARISKLPRTQITQRTKKIPRTKHQEQITSTELEADVAKGPIRASHFQSN